MSKNEDYQKDLVVFFVPAGALMGMGLGFLVDNLLAGLMIGLGGGFFMWAVSGLIAASNDKK